MSTVKHSPEWVIVGAGGFAREVAWQINSWDANGGILMAVEPEFLPDPPEVGAYEVTTIDDALNRTDGYTGWMLGVGSVQLRKRLDRAISNDPRFTVWNGFRSPHTVQAFSAKRGDGSYIGPGCVVSVGAAIGRHALVNQCCSIGHDVTIGEHAVLCPGCVLSGNVTVGDGAFLGSGVIVYPGVTIGAGSSVPAGTVVKRSVPDGTIVWRP